LPCYSYSESCQHVTINGGNKNDILDSFPEMLLIVADEKVDSMTVKTDLNSPEEAK